MKKPLLTAERLRELLCYDPHTGLFEWVATRTPRVQAGARAGCLGAGGYMQIKVDGRHYKAHRLAYLYMLGQWPVAGIDHRDGSRTNNAWRNLRNATDLENAQNKKLPCTNTSGFRGVTWSKKVGRWQAQLRADRGTKFLGYFDDPAIAHQVYLAARAEAFKFHPVPRDSEPVHVGELA